MKLRLHALAATLLAVALTNITSAAVAASRDVRYRFTITNYFGSEKSYYDRGWNKFTGTLDRNDGESIPATFLIRCVEGARYMHVESAEYSPILTAFNDRLRAPKVCDQDIQDLVQTVRSKKQYFLFNGEYRQPIDAAVIRSSDWIGTVISE